jgi:glycogen operon protein
MQTLRTARGRSLPLGATALADGVNFVLLCRHGSSVRLVLYALDTSEILADIPLEPRKHRTGDHWHVMVKGLPAAFRYGWRVDGPPGAGNRFNPNIVLLDPASTSIAGDTLWSRVDRGLRIADRGSNTEDRKSKIETQRSLAARPLANPQSSILNPQSSILNPHPADRLSLFIRRPYDWREDTPPLVPLEDSVIYELHVRGFTIHPSAGVSKPGTFAGLLEKLPYLQSLGVTAVELLPVHEFDEDDCPFTNPLTDETLRNFWGYNSIAFAAPKAAYAWSGRQHNQVVEFRDMVRAFHAAGIEVILDVVFNHTGEGDDRGRTYSFRGLDNELYYLLDAKGNYLNFSGCGNTVNCNHPVVRDLILTCLRFWVAEMHVDGLRFDLASVLGRDQHGNVLVEPPIVEMIAEDGVLRDTKLIAEPWDATGLYQLGRFPFGRRWSEWNARYRDDVRRFWRGDPGLTEALATRLAGSADLYEATGRLPIHSINFVTCHDGFTLWDLVSYNRKHNEANAEGNRDGLAENYSWNFGVEGPTADPAIDRLRRRQAKNFLVTLLLSQGLPMLLAGDEFLRTQAGNNNAYCQDNAVSWIDWTLAQTNAEMLRFTRMMIALRKRHPALRRRTFFDGAARRHDGRPDILWHGVEPEKPDFSRISRSLAFSLDGTQTGREPDQDFYVVCNAWREPLDFTIPRSPNSKPWRRVIDTALPSPLDIVEPAEGPVLPARTAYRVTPFSVVVLISEA